MGDYNLGKNSKKNLITCTSNIQSVVNETILLGLIDFSVLEGVRNKEKQNRYFNFGKSRVKWPNSKHNVINPMDKSIAVDLAPWINRSSSYKMSHCCYLAGVVMAVGTSMGVKLRWGGDWDMDGEPITDQDFQDLVHFEEII